MDNQITDNSCVDDSITIHATGSTITTKKESTGLRLNWTLVMTLVIGAALCFQTFSQSRNEKIESMLTRLDDIDDRLHAVGERLDKQIASTRQEIDKGRETSVWLIRWDIISAIDLYEAKGEVSENELKHLTEELEYYKTKLNGNHGVDERWAGFRSKMMSGSVKVSK